MSATQKVITIDDISADNAPVIYVAGGLKQFFEHAKAQATGEVPDLTTRKGRERVASLAAEVSRSKTAVEKPGRDYLRRLKEMPKVVEAELREFVTEMDALRDQVRQPLTEWELAEKARVQGHKDSIDWLTNRDDGLSDLTSAQVAQRIDEVEAFVIGKHLEEFEADAARAKDAVLAKLRPAFTARQAHEAELAEIARFNAEKAEREQRERDEAITREAAEKAQREAAERAAAELAASAKREQDLRDQAAAQQLAAEQAARDAEAAAERQRLQLQIQAEQAEKAAAQAKADQLAAEQRVEQAAEKARQAEIQRQEDAKAEEARQIAAREADKTHKLKINRAALDAFVAGGMTEECAKQAITLIAQRKIPNITIQY